jgi:hypothetical protein
VTSLVYYPRTSHYGVTRLSVPFRPRAVVGALATASLGVADPNLFAAQS